MHVTPGYVFAAGERITLAKLNQLAVPAVTFDLHEVGTNELIAADVLAIVNPTGRNLFCNGDFAYWPIPDDTGTGPASVSGVFPGGRKHDYIGVARWVIANDANRTISRQAFTPGQADVPGSPFYFARWAQSAAIANTINPAYFGQRLELVGNMSGRTVTFTVWVRSNVGLNVVPSLRQFFGDAGSGAPSADVITDKAAVALSANTWTKVKATWTVPSVAGKTIVEGTTPANPGSFTEFRIVAPQGIAFTLDFARAQLVEGSLELGFDARPAAVDLTEAQRFRQYLGIMLSNNLATNGSPSINLPVKPRVGIGLANLTLLFNSGTGATIGVDGDVVSHILQLTNHSAIVQAKIFVDCELHAPA